MNAKRLLICAFAVAVSLALAASISLAQADDARDDPMMKFVPAGADLLVVIDLERALEMPVIEELKVFLAEDDPGFKKFLALAEKHGIELNELCGKLVFFAAIPGFDDDDAGDEIAGFIAKTAVAQAALMEILEAEADELNLIYRAGTIGDRDAILMAEKGFQMLPPDVAPPMRDATAMVYLDREHVLIAPVELAGGILTGIDAGATVARAPIERLAGIEADALVWGLHQKTGELLAENIMGMEDGPLADILSVFFSLSFVKPDEPDMRLRLIVESGAAENAQALFAMAGQYRAALPMLLEDNPALARILTDATELNMPGDREVGLSLLIEEELRVMFVAALKNARREARKVASMNNLKQIGTAILVYQNAHDDRYPDNYQNLYPRFIDDLNVFVSPLDPRKERIEAAAEIEAKSSYIYNPNVRGKKLDDMPNWIYPLAIERTENYDGKGTIVLNTDTSIRYVEGDELARVLEQMRAQ